MHDVLIGWVIVALAAAICAIYVAAAWLRDERARDKKALDILCAAIETEREDA